jgi:DNA polymerase I-like protein with 3'-5' exonuclease and polymerase domains
LIQSTVADALSSALVLIEKERNRLDMKFKIVLAVHDAVILEVPYEEVRAARDLLVRCMSEDTVVPGVGLRYGVDVEVFQRWNEKLVDPEVLELCGLNKE